jgi:hypothetical protein
VQKHDPPNAVPFEEDIGFLIVSLRNLAFCVACPHMKDVARDGTVPGRTNLNILHSFSPMGFALMRRVTGVVFARDCIL